MRNLLSTTLAVFFLCLILAGTLALLGQGGLALGLWDRVWSSRDLGLVCLGFAIGVYDTVKRA